MWPPNQQAVLLWHFLSKWCVFPMEGELFSPSCNLYLRQGIYSKCSLSLAEDLSPFNWLVSETQGFRFLVGWKLHPEKPKIQFYLFCVSSWPLGIPCAISLSLTKHLKICGCNSSSVSKYFAGRYICFFRKTNSVLIPSSACVQNEGFPTQKHFLPSGCGPHVFYIPASLLLSAPSLPPSVLAFHLACELLKSSNCAFFVPVSPPGTSPAQNGTNSSP